ncbi:SIMPL domain-containing protein [Flavicella sp.]|uniref:SIMPL domain-containing protein n=1 Tax=Flavicella sp. TaxID=2957742 RepID=UPI00261380AA|nr:SIMPL domain-containing protein [Flavicella sp.]MDG1806241.1 SIMPL domain-containing protein [Flavicella sp.]
MKKLGIIIMLFGICIANAQTKNFIDQSYIDTTAKVDTLVVPDRVYVTIILQEEDSKGKISLESLEKKMQKVLKNAKVNLAQDLEVRDMSSNFKKYFLKEKDIHKSKSYALLLYDAKTAQQVLTELEQVGISNVFLEKTEYSKIDSLELNLKSLAITKAKTQAEHLTKPLGQEIGKALYIMDRNQHHNNYRNNNLDEVVVIGYGSQKNETSSVAFEFEKIRIETTVTVKFELK